jgi:hypothetical protein
MKKAQALAFFGGTVTATAKALGITSSAVSQWPEDGDLPRSVEDRILAELARRHLPASMIDPAMPTDAPTPAPVPAEHAQASDDEDDIGDTVQLAARMLQRAGADDLAPAPAVTERRAVARPALGRDGPSNHGER